VEDLSLIVAVPGACCPCLGTAGQTSEVEEAINRVKQGDFDLADVGIIAEAHAVAAIPILKDLRTVELVRRWRVGPISGG